MPIQTQEVRRRLLDLFPKETILEDFQTEEGVTKAEAIADIAESAQQPELREFVAENFGYLHQHVYLFEYDDDDGVNLDLTAPFGVAPFSSITVGGEQHHHYLLELRYDIVLDSPLEHDELVFAWPLRLVVAPDHIRVHFCIMAKSVTAYVSEDRGIVKSTPRRDERGVLDGFPASLGVLDSGPLDLNKGIKTLWSDDEFDAPMVKYKRAKATSKDTMDENFLVKRDDPTLYADVADKPLFKTIFLFPEEDEPCIDYFVTDPTNGTVTFRRFSASKECVDDVIRKVLAAN